MLPLQQQRSGCTFDPRLCRIIKSSLRMKISLAPLQLFQGLYWVHFSTIVLRKLQFQTLTYSSQETSVNYTVSVRWEGFPSFRIYKTVWASIHAMLVISTVSRTLWHSAFYSRLSKVMLHHFNMKVSFEARKKKENTRPVPTGSVRRRFCLFQTCFLFALVKSEPCWWTHAPLRLQLAQ